MERNQEKRLQMLFKIVDMVRLIDATLPIQTLAAFIAIALHEGESITAIGQRVGTSQSSTSRNISSLSDWDYKKKEGLKLVEYKTDPMNLSSKSVHLTAKGRKLIDHILTELE